MRAANFFRESPAHAGSPLEMSYNAFPPAAPAPQNGPPMPDAGTDQGTSQAPEHNKMVERIKDLTDRLGELRRHL